jgi:hypothetical protein
LTQEGRSNQPGKALQLLTVPPQGSRHQPGMDCMSLHPLQ